VDAPPSRLDDKENHLATVKTMNIIKFSEEEKESVQRIIAGILHLGNLKFETAFGEGSDKDALNKASEVLGIDGAKLEHGLCKPRNEYVQTQLNNVEKALYSV